MEKKIRRPLATMITCILLIIGKIYNIISPGKRISAIIPCQNVPENSFPCYSTYDIYIVIAFATLALLSATLIIIHIIKKITLSIS